MSINTNIGALVLGATLALSSMAAAQRPSRQVGNVFRRPPAQPAQAVATPPAPVNSQPAQAQPIPATPELVPATPPRVSMTQGLLTITAENSTLGDILSQVKSVTGASVEAPSSASPERVVVKLGPGKPQEVLQQLFAGSKFDYIILGSNENPESVQKIILTQRGAAGTVAANNAGPNQPQNRFQPPPPPPDMSADNQIEDETVQPETQEQVQQEEVAPPPAGAPQQQIGPGGQAQAVEQNEQNQNGQQQGQQPKTPEQLLQELQKMQQQQQQQGDPNRQQRPPQDQ